jgi:hypothetical protein
VANVAQSLVEPKSAQLDLSIKSKRQVAYDTELDIQI